MRSFNDLDPEYLRSRHSFWIRRISDKGIWYANAFKPVEIRVGRRTTRLQGKFMRTRRRSGFRIKTEDYIIIYLQHHPLSPREIDNTLVHEMIHQYIAQNSMRDSGPHGSLFKSFMNRINNSFPDELSISVRGKLKQEQGPGETLHHLIFLNLADGSWIVCRVAHARLAYFINMIRRDGAAMRIASFCLATSFDRYFDSFKACRTRLGGKRLSGDEMTTLWRECHVSFIPLDL